LSFDILRDSLGDGRTDYPLTAYLVAGTQAEVAKQNLIILMKMSQLKRTEQEGTC
jgi:ribosome assembly protein RRB1